MTQSRLGSLIESVVNILIGYGIAFATQVIVFPWFGIHVPLSSQFGIGAIFTVVSLVRSYAIRRWFNAYIHRAAVRVAGEVS